MIFIYQKIRSFVTLGKMLLGKLLPRQNGTRQVVTRQNVTRQNVTRQIVTRQNVAEPRDQAYILKFLSDLVDIQIKHSRFIIFLQF